MITRPLAVFREQLGLFDIDALPEYTVRFNVAPTDPVPIVRRAAADQRRELLLARWGLLPAFARDPREGAKMINARAESVAEKPAFRRAFAHQRCLVLADGFYEWSRQGKQRQAHLFSRSDGAPFAFAGLYEPWLALRAANEGRAIESCAVITTVANALVEKFHDRMPVILGPEAFATWLDPRASRETLESLLQPLAASQMREHPVGPRVNHVENDSPDCILPAALVAPVVREAPPVQLELLKK